RGELGRPLGSFAPTHNRDIDAVYFVRALLFKAHRKGGGLAGLAVPPRTQILFEPANQADGVQALHGRSPPHELGGALHTGTARCIATPQTTFLTCYQRSQD